MTINAIIFRYITQSTFLEKNAYIYKYKQKPLSVIVVNNKKTSSSGIFCSSNSPQAQGKKNQEQLSRKMKGSLCEIQPSENI